MVYGVDDTEHTYGKCPAVLVVFKGDYDAEDAQNRFEKFIKDNLAYHLRPVQISAVSALPVTKSGKLDYFRAGRAINIH